MNKKGFTLLELLVVVLIIGILAGIALPQYRKAVYKARATEAMILLKALSDAQETFYLANGEYTNDIGELDIQIPTELISEDTTGNFTDTYSYSCKEQRTCSARVNNANMPFFEFNLIHGSVSGIAGKKYCHVFGYPTTKNDIAKSICQNMGVLDTDSSSSEWFVGKYYRLN